MAAKGKQASSTVAHHFVVVVNIGQHCSMSAVLCLLVISTCFGALGVDEACLQSSVQVPLQNCTLYICPLLCEEHVCVQRALDLWDDTWLVCSASFNVSTFCANLWCALHTLCSTSKKVFTFLPLQSAPGWCALCAVLLSMFPLFVPLQWLVCTVCSALVRRPRPPGSSCLTLVTPGPSSSCKRNPFSVPVCPLLFSDFSLVPGFASLFFFLVLFGSSLLFGSCLTLVSAGPLSSCERNPFSLAVSSSSLVTSSS